MPKKLFILLLDLCLSTNILLAQSTKIRLGIQLNTELYRYTSIKYNPDLLDYETGFKIHPNLALTTFGSINLTKHIWFNFGISYIKQSFYTIERFNQNLHVPPGANIPAINIVIKTNKQDYNIIEYPLGLTVYLKDNDKRFQPKLMGNIIGKQLINIRCYFNNGSSVVEKQNQFYGIASNFGVGFDYHVNNRMILEFNCLYRFYNMRREQPIIYGNSDTYFNDNKGIINFALGLQFNLTHQ